MILILRTFSYLAKKYRTAFYFAIACMVLMDIVSYLVPLLIQYATDEIFPFIADAAVVERLYLFSIAIIVAGVVRGLLSHFMIRSYWFVGESVARDLRNQLYEKLQHLGAPFYATARTGDLMSRITTDIQLLRNFYAFGVEHRLRIILISITVLGFMLYQNWRLALLVYLFLPVVYFVIIYFSNHLRKAVMHKHRTAGDLSAALQENLSGIRHVKAYAVEKNQQDLFDKKNNRLLNADLRVATLQAHLNPILMLTGGIGSLTILLYGGYQVINDAMSMGTLLGFMTYLMIMRFPLFILGFNTSLISLAQGATIRINEIIQMKDQRNENRGRYNSVISGTLNFSNICFEYDAHRPVLKNLSFSIAAGERVAIFGLNGSGKSSLISLIPRFYQPSSGEITLDGITLNDWELEYLRSQIGIVLQETFLFSVTIGENIAFGKPEASMDEIVQVAKTARIHDYIESLPEGYNTKVGEYGAGLSGGQKQRIAIARALLQNPRILILDDCTSSLDPATEREIQVELRTLMKGRTTLIIAQRISTLKLADRIIVLDRGTIQDFDSHEQLLKKNELYRVTFETQMVCCENIFEDSLTTRS